MRRFLRRGERDTAGIPVAFEHPTQLGAATFLRAVAEGDLSLIWERLSRESRGLLEGRYAARSGVSLARAAGVGEEVADSRLERVVAPLRASILRALGGDKRVGAMGVSAARQPARRQAFVLLLPDFGEERMATEEDWRPGHLLAFIHEEREWRVDIGLTATLSAEAGLPDPLGGLR